MLQKKVDILFSFTGYRDDCICFKTGGPSDPEAQTYSFVDTTSLQSSALRQFHERIALGDSFPDRMIFNHGCSLDRALALLLFQQPELVLTSTTTDLVNAVDLYTRLGVAGLSLSPPHMRKLLGEAGAYLASMNQPPDAMLQGMMKAGAVFAEHIRLNKTSEALPFDHDIHEYFVRHQNATYQVADVYASGYLGGFWYNDSMAMIYKKSILFEQIDLDALQKRLHSKSPRKWIRLDDGCTLLLSEPLSTKEADEIWDSITTLLDEVKT